jgi:hypothetical protein
MHEKSSCMKPIAYLLIVTNGTWPVMSAAHP